MVGGATAPLRQTVLALAAGVRLAEHEALGAATLQVLRGRVRLTAATMAGNWARARPARSPC
jgi:quercetin dioxygenase-like cupin family protein